MAPPTTRRSRIPFSRFWMRLRLRVGDGERGASPVELAIAMPVILLLAFLGIQFSLWFLARDVAVNAANEAVTAQRAYGAAPDAGQTRADNYLAKASDWLLNPQVVVVRNGDEVTATVTGTSLPFITSMTVTQSAHGPVERFTTEGQP